MARAGRGPKFVQFFDPVMKALKELGGSGRPAEVVEVVARLKGISDAQRQEVLQSGALRFDNQIAFARQYLVWGGFLDSSKRGVWSLTQKGLA
jgi:restriction system protein